MTKNSKLTLYFFALTVIAGVILRYFQLIRTIDYSTGFFKADSGLLGASVYILFAAAAIGYVVFPIIDKKIGSAAFKKHARSITLTQQSAFGVLLLLVGCAVFADTVELIGLSEAKNALLIGVSILAAIAFIGAGFFFLGSGESPQYGIFLLFLSVYYTFRAAYVFITYLTVARMSVQLIEMFAYISMVLFLIAFGRFISRGESKFSRNKFCFFAGAAGVLTGVSTLPAIAVSLFAEPDIKSASQFPPYELIACFVLVCGVMAVMFSSKLKKSKKLHIIEETIEPPKEAVRITDEPDEPEFSGDGEDFRGISGEYARTIRRLKRYCR